jgi:low affinity Fe/Cu permease
VKDLFRRFAQWISQTTGNAGTFIVSLIIVLVWLVSGPLFRYSDTWQLVINTGTTIITFLMVFILQNTQNRDNTAVQLKLDELLRAVSKARDSFIDIEELADEELDALADEMKTVREEQGVEGESPIGQAARAERERRKNKAPAKQGKSTARAGGRGGGGSTGKTASRGSK